MPFRFALTKVVMHLICLFRQGNSAVPRIVSKYVRGQRGVTLLELLVVFAVLGILAALILAAIQSGRQAARRVSCASNLRQLGLALQQYEATHGVFPPGSSRLGSLHVSILPFVEAANVFETYTSCVQSGGDPYQCPMPVIETFICPDDPAPSLLLSSGKAGTNYVGCSGVWVLADNWSGMFRYWSQSPSERGPVHASEITAGLSNTAAMSEILRADNSHHWRRVYWNTPAPLLNLDAFTSICESVPENASAVGWTGDPWFRGTPWNNSNVGGTLYNHASSPNRPSCVNGSEISSGISTAGSMHPKGVNLLFADGHIAFFSDSVDLQTWRALASRNRKGA